MAEREPRPPNRAHTAISAVLTQRFRPHETAAQLGLRISINSRTIEHDRPPHAPTRRTDRLLHTLQRVRKTAEIANPDTVIGASNCISRESASNV